MVKVDGVVLQSAAMQRVAELALRPARADTAVLTTAIPGRARRW